MTTHYRTVSVDGLDIFYREAGRADAPAILLPHGFPSASHIFRDLIPESSGAYRVIAPDLPGFGQSAGTEAFKRDIPYADVRLFDTGHFALETHAKEIGSAIREFLNRTVG